jgi:hypothetical protein
MASHPMGILQANDQPCNFKRYACVSVQQDNSFTTKKILAQLLFQIQSAFFRRGRTMYKFCAVAGTFPQ